MTLPALKVKNGKIYRGQLLDEIIRASTLSRARPAALTALTASVSTRSPRCPPSHRLHLKSMSRNMTCYKSVT
eukprot:2451711-Pleurochrysis_carterae.AAC.3